MIYTKLHILCRFELFGLLSAGIGQQFILNDVKYDEILSLINQIDFVG